MKIYLFGTGRYYNLYKKCFRKEDILALLDNSPKKQGQRIDGFEVLAPNCIRNSSFDYIVILSVYYTEIRSQLIELGVEEKKIIGYTDLYQHPDLIRKEEDLLFQIPPSLLSDFTRNSREYIVLLSHDLDLNGASLALYQAGLCLKKNGIKTCFVSWHDGPIRELLKAEGIPVIVDENLFINSYNRSAWTKAFHYFFCNTIEQYRFLADRDIDCECIWWLHDPLMFYDAVDKKILGRIPAKNLKVYSAGPIPAQAFQSYRGDIPVGQLIFGTPDPFDGVKNPLVKKDSDAFTFSTIANTQPYKGQDVLLDALQELKSPDGKKIIINLVGAAENQFTSQLRMKAEEINQEGKRISVRIYPTLDRDRVKELLYRTDVYVCPSRVDSMSVSTVEAMALSRPCIVSDATGISAYVKDDFSGLVFPSENAFILAEKMEWCVENPKALARIGKESRKIYEENFSMQVFEESLMNMIRVEWGIGAEF